MPHTSWLFEICGHSSLFAEGFNNQKKIFIEKFPTNPHGLAEKFSCNSDKGNYMLEKCSVWKSSESIDDMKLESSWYS